MIGFGYDYPAGAEDDPAAPYNEKECANCDELVDGDQRYCAACDEEMG